VKASSSSAATPPPPCPTNHDPISFNEWVSSPRYTVESGQKWNADDIVLPHTYLPMCLPVPVQNISKETGYLLDCSGVFATAPSPPDSQPARASRTSHGQARSGCSKSILKQSVHALNKCSGISVFQQTITQAKNASKNQSDRSSAAGAW